MVFVYLYFSFFIVSFVFSTLLSVCFYFQQLLLPCLFTCSQPPPCSCSKWWRSTGNCRCLHPARYSSQSKSICYHHIITFPPWKIPTIVTPVFGSIDSRQSPSIDSKLHWGNQGVHQIQLQEAVSQRGREIFSICYSIFHILPRGWIHLFSRLVQWPSAILEQHTWLPSARNCKKKTLAPRYLLWKPDNVVKFLQMVGSKITNY